jgi:hypothetical protein
MFWSKRSPRLAARDFLLRDAGKLTLDIEDEEQVATLARRYEVSRQAMTYRLMNLFGESLMLLWLRSLLSRIFRKPAPPPQSAPGALKRQRLDVPRYAGAGEVPPMHWKPCHPATVRRFKAEFACRWHRASQRRLSAAGLRLSRFRSTFALRRRSRLAGEVQKAIIAHRHHFASVTAPIMANWPSLVLHQGAPP